MPHRLVLVGAASALLFGCDSVDEPAAAPAVQFTQQVGGVAVNTGRFTPADVELDLRRAMRATVDALPGGGYSLYAEYTELPSDYKFIVLIIDDRSYRFSAEAILLGAGSPASRVDVPPRDRGANAARSAATVPADIVMFTLADPGQRPSGTLSLRLRLGGGPEQTLTYDVGRHVVQSRPALRVVGGDLSLADEDEGSGFFAESDSTEVERRALNVFRNGYSRSTESCSSDAGFIPARWEATLAAGVSTSCSSLVPETFEHLVYYLDL